MRRALSRLGYGFPSPSRPLARTNLPRDRGGSERRKGRAIAAYDWDGGRLLLGARLDRRSECGDSRDNRESNRRRTPTSPPSCRQRKFGAKGRDTHESVDAIARSLWIFVSHPQALANKPGKSAPLC